MTDLFDFEQFPILTTDRLRLRHLEPNDADSIMNLFSAPEVLRFLNQEPTDTQEKALGLIQWFEDMFRAKEAVQWAITLRDTNRFIGMCGNIAWQKDNRKIDIGYHILPDMWGKGYATEAASAIIKWSFIHLNLHRIQADCTVGNIASERVLLKCGFSVEGILRESEFEHGRFVDIKQFGLLRREFKFD
jgi:[ribosomal protein S5]-alanine N-acetyltransferase